MSCARVEGVEVSHGCFGRADDATAGRRRWWDGIASRADARAESGPPVVLRRGRGRGLRIAVAAAALVLVIVAVTWWPSLRRRIETPAMQVMPLTVLPGHEQWPTFSPDGDQVAFEWDGENGDNADIYITMVGSSEVRRLTSESGEATTRQLVA